jgi:hypothetical protein
MRAPARVLADVRREVVQDEQNPAVRILLANSFEALADLLFSLVCGETHHARTVESVETDRWFVRTNQRSGDMWIIDIVESL